MLNANVETGKYFIDIGLSNRPILLGIYCLQNSFFKIVDKANSFLTSDLGTETNVINTTTVKLHSLLESL